MKYSKNKYNMILLVLPSHRCVLALYTQYFPESCEKNQSQAYWLVPAKVLFPQNTRARSQAYIY